MKGGAAGVLLNFRSDFEELEGSDMLETCYLVNELFLEGEWTGYVVVCLFVCSCPEAWEIVRPDWKLRVPVLSRFAPRSKLETLASTANTWYRSFQNENLIFMFGPRSLAFSGMTSVWSEIAGSANQHAEFARSANQQTKSTIQKIKPTYLCAPRKFHQNCVCHVL